MNTQIVYRKPSMTLSKKGKRHLCDQPTTADMNDSKTRTRDMGGNSTTHDFTRSVLDHMDTA